MSTAATIVLNRMRLGNGWLGCKLCRNATSANNGMQRTTLRFAADAEGR